MAKITVIVPIYKVKEYLRRCVDSILAQTFTDFELVLVDDGSPDECGEICDEYGISDKRVTVIHQSNMGLSEARNSGIEWALKNSDSEWLTFIDSDDWIHRDYLKLLYNAATENDVDLSICNCIKTSDFSVEDAEPKFEYKLFTPEGFWCFRQYGGAWAKLYRKEHFKDIRYPKGLLFEDAFVTYRMIFMQTKVVYIEDPLYYYFLRNDSITKSKWDPRYLARIDGGKQQINYFKKNGYKDAYRLTVKNFVVLLRDQAETVKSQGGEGGEYIRYYSKLKRKFKFYLLRYHKILPIRDNIKLYRYGFPLFTRIYKKIYLSKKSTE